MIDWRRILDQHHVSYVEHGPSTAKDNIYIPCPWCGDHMPRMGISLRGNGWGCWREPRHRGKSPARLLAAVLRITMARARVMLGQEARGLPDDGDLASLVRDTLAGQGSHPEAPFPDMPEELRPLYQDGPRRGIFLDYLRDRGYPDDAERVAGLYDLRYAITGPFTYRVVIPVYDAGENLVTLTGRSIVPDVDLRYLTLSPDPDSKLVARGLPMAHAPITDYLFNEHYLYATRPDVLVVVEGAFDAIRVDLAMRLDRDAAATCLFGKAINAMQVNKLADLCSTCEHRFLLLDPDARFSTFGIVARLEPLGFQPIYLDERWDDPGDRNLPLGEIRRIVREEISKRRHRS